MKAETRSYLEMHLAVIAWGFTAILGDLIAMSALMIVFWRVLITSISLFIIWKISKKIPSISKKQLMIYAGIGVLVGLHWLTFYGAVKLSNASVTLICMATTSFMTSLIEPIIVKSKFSPLDMSVGLFIVPGMIFIVNGLPDLFLGGVIVGLISAFLATVFSVLNKKYVTQAEPVYISMIEISSATLSLGIIIPFVFWFGNQEMLLLPTRSLDWTYIFILALLCTTLPFILSIKALHHLSAFASNLVINLEPVYGIILAILILKEHNEMSLGFYIGSTIIVISVFFYPFLKKRFKPIHL